MPTSPSPTPPTSGGRGRRPDGRDRGARGGGRPVSGHGTLRIVQLNIGSLLEPHWDERRREIVAWLDRLDADLVCLQEVWESADSPNTAGWLVDNAGGPERWAWCFGGYPLPEALWPDQSLRFGSAILSRWP